ncbi:MAG: PHB depolymerase family esterase [Minicystis sp.]
MRRAAALAAFVVFSAPGLAPAAPGSAQTTLDWPCPGCVVHVPARLPEGPRPLLVALHGDGGAMRPLVRAWQAACDEAGVILLAPRCPRETGCAAGSYWQWLQDARHDERWLGGLIDAVAARWPVDPARVYATGYSGGATYLGWYVPTHPTRFAAIAHVAGGAPYGRPCPACKVPVLFVIGSVDPMIGPYTAPLRAYYDGCGGHEVVWQALPGVTHEGILGTLQAGRAKEVLRWLLARPAACAVDPGDAGASDAGAMDASPADAGAIDAGYPGDAAPAPAVAADAGEAIPPAPARVPPRSGCACGWVEPSAGGTRGLASLVALGAAVTRRYRRRASEVGALRRRCR